MAKSAIGASLATVAFAFLPLLALGQSVAAGYARVENSVVKVWSLDAHGAPIAAGTGIIIDSNDSSSTVLTATHVIKGAAAILVDLDRTVHDLSATVVAASPYDITILKVNRGNLKTVRFAARPVAIGDPIAFAGFYRSDEAGGEIRHLLSPGTVSALVQDGTLIEFDDLGVHEGVGGGPLFDPATGNVVGIVSTRTADGRGGFAVAARPVLIAFLNAQHVRVALATPPVAPTAPPPSPAATTVALPPRAGHPPAAAESWLPIDGLPGMFWLWTSAGYVDGYQSIDLFLTNDYVKNIFFFPEIRLTIDGKPYDFYFNEKRTFSVAAASSHAFRLRFGLPRAVQSLFVSMHDVRFGSDDGPLLLPR